MDFDEIDLAFVKISGARNWAIEIGYIILFFNYNFCYNSGDPECTRIISAGVPVGCARAGHDARRLGLPWRGDISGTEI